MFSIQKCLHMSETLHVPHLKATKVESYKQSACLSHILDSCHKHVTCTKQISLTFTSFTSCKPSDFSEQGWHSGESAHLPPMCPRFNSWTQHHMWVEFVSGCLLCSKMFFLQVIWFSPFLKPTFPNSNSSLESVPN